MDEKDRERRNSDDPGSPRRPGAHSSSLGIVDRRRRAEERKNNIRSLNPEPEIPSRAREKIRTDEETDAKRKAANDGSDDAGDPSNKSTSAGAQSVSSRASDRAKRKEERQRQTGAIQTSTTPGDEPAEQVPLDESYQVEATAVNDDEADERVRRLEEQMAAMIQGASPAVAVVNANSEAEESDDEYEGMTFFQRYRCGILIVLALVAIGGGVAGYLLGTQASPVKPIDSSAPPNAAPTEAPAVAPTQAPLDAIARRDLLEALLNDGLVSIQPAALNWLSDVDTWTPEDGSSTESQQWIERYVMVVFYNATNGDDWRNNAGWLDTSKSVCDGWRGIESCDNDLIIDMNFPSFNLDGSLPSEIGLLTELTGFIANNNELVGSIPKETGQMRSLVQLKLDNNRLVGSIPTEIGRLANMDDLDLFSNLLTGTIPTEIGNLRNIQELELERNTQLSGTIPTEVGLLTRLSQFTVFETNVGGSIPSELGLATALENVELDNLPLQGTLPTEIGNLVRLEKFDVFTTRISGRIPSEIGLMISLTKLDLDDSRLSGEIPVEIIHLTNLNELQLDQNELSGVVPPLPSSLSVCELHSNCFSDIRNAPQRCLVDPNCR